MSAQIASYIRAKVTHFKCLNVNQQTMISVISNHLGAYMVDTHNFNFYLHFDT